MIPDLVISSSSPTDRSFAFPPPRLCLPFSHIGRKSNQGTGSTRNYPMSAISPPLNPGRVPYSNLSENERPPGTAVYQVLLLLIYDTSRSKMQQGSTERVLWRCRCFKFRLDPRRTANDISKTAQREAMPPVAANGSSTHPQQPARCDRGSNGEIWAKTALLLCDKNVFLFGTCRMNMIVYLVRNTFSYVAHVVSVS